jgi:3-oxoacyl-[acyl-carrier-protein] synthase-3
MSVPANVVDNAPIAARLGLDDGWIERRTGIRSRHVAELGERVQDLAAQAGRAALERAAIEPADVDLVLVATTTPDDVLPNVAPLVADALGCVRAGGIDVGAACTGFVSALALAAGQVETGRMRNVLVIGADIMTRFLDHDDRQTAALFADGAGAVLVGATDGESRVAPMTLGADGGAAELICIAQDERQIRMAGQETFRHAVARLSESTVDAVALAGLTLDDIDLFVYHQANRRILRAVGERLDLPEERIVDCIATYGNTSAATLPIALAVAEEEGRLNRGDRVLLGAFGAGLTWGAGVIEWGAS